MKKCFSCLLFFGFIANNLIFSQSKSFEAGLKLSGEMTFNYGLAPLAGVQVIYKMNICSGIESGIYWQKRKFLTITTEGFPVNTEFYTSKIYSHRLQLPLLYRFSSKLINFNVGPVVDIPIGTSIKTEDPDPALKRIRSYKTGIILTGGISHSFFLSPKYLLEPELSFNYLTQRKNGGVGINLIFRRNFF